MVSEQIATTVAQPWRHEPGCPCLGCADFRERIRAKGHRPQPALDWRGVPLKGREQ